MVERLQIAVLGPVGVSSGEDDFMAVRGHQGSLLAVLAAHFPKAVEQDAVIEALWPVSAPASAKGSLGVALHRLRSRLPDSSMIVTEGSTYRLNVEPAQLDVSEFLAKTSDPITDAGMRADTLDEALALWRGRPFQPFGDELAFVTVTSELLEAKRQTEEQLLEALLEAGRAKEAANRAASLVDAEPYRERRWELFMLALYRSSRQADALRAAQRARQTLGDDLGLEPGPGLQELEAAILGQDPSLVIDAGDVSGQLGPLVEVRTQPRRLPTHNNAFVGRNDELEALALAIEQHRWVGVDGPPGIGKTRLVSQYCLGDSQQRTIWIEAAGYGPREVLGGLAKHLGVRPDDDDAVGALLPALASEPTLVILDTPDREVCEFVPRLVSDSDAVCVVTITRAPAKPEPHHRVSVGGLDDGVAVAILTAGSDLAADVAADVINEIGTTPLHVELFSAQLNFASVGELLDDWRGPVAHVDDQLVRALDWSVERLDEAETSLYEYLGVHASWCSTADIAGVVGLPVPLVRRHLATLVNAGLARSSRSVDGAGHVRYRLDLSMRSHAVDRLREDGRLNGARECHARHFAELANRRGLEAASANEQVAVEHLHEVLPELHFALDHFVESGMADEAIAFVLALREYAFFRLEFRTLDWANRVVAMPTAKVSANYDELLAAAGLCAWAGDRMPRASTYANEAIDLAESHDRPPPITALRTRLNVAAANRDADGAMRSMLALIEGAERTGSERDRSDCLVNQVLGATFAGNGSDAMRAAIQALALAETTENPTSIAWAKFALGCAELLRHPEPALANFAESLRLAQTVQNRWVVSSALGGVATAARLGGRSCDAADPLLALLDIWVGLRKERFFAKTLNEIALVLLELEHPDSARTVLGWARGHNADALLLPEDRARLRQAVSELAPPLVGEVFEIRAQARGAAELLSASGASTASLAV